MEVPISNTDLEGVKGKVVVVTGGSSGIGLATVNLLLSLGAVVVNADVNEPPETPSSEAFSFVKIDVASWKDLCALFAKAQTKHGGVDSVFANAGIAPRANYLDIETDDEGAFLEPNTQALDIMLRGVINTCCLAAHYMKQQRGGGSIVLMGSSTGLQPFRAPDYSTAKHGVLGFGRGYARLMEAAGLPIRVNTLMPSWTVTNLLPDFAGLLAGARYAAQEGTLVARAAVYLMANVGDRQGDVVFVSGGKCTEIEKAVLAPACEAIQGLDYPGDDEILRRIQALDGGVPAAG